MANAQDTNDGDALLPCDTCSRTFMPGSLDKHKKICEKANSKKRKPFDSAKQRIKGTELAEYLPKLDKRRHHSLEEDKSIIVARSSWKDNHNDFLRTIRAARGDIIDQNVQRQTCSSVVSGGAPTRSNEKGICPSCNRNFGIKAYERHVAWCKEKSTRVQINPATNIAKERLEARIKYRAPSVKNRRTTIRDKYSSNKKCIKIEPSPVKQSKPAIVRRPSLTRESLNTTQQPGTKLRLLERMNRCDSTISLPSRFDRSQLEGRSLKIENNNSKRSSRLIDRLYDKVPRIGNQKIPTTKLIVEILNNLIDVIVIRLECRGILLSWFDGMVFEKPWTIRRKWKYRVVWKIKFLTKIRRRKKKLLPNSCSTPVKINDETFLIDDTRDVEVCQPVRKRPRFQDEDKEIQILYQGPRINDTINEDSDDSKISIDSIEVEKKKDDYYYARRKIYINEPVVEEETIHRLPFLPNIGGRVYQPVIPEPLKFPPIFNNRNPEQRLRPVWNNYVRKRPDFNLVLKGRTGSWKDYDPFLLAEQQMHDLLSSDTSDPSSVTGDNQTTTKLLLKNNNRPSAFVKYPNLSPILPTNVEGDNKPMEFDELSRNREFGRKLIIDRTKALGSSTNNNNNNKIIKPTVARSNSIRIPSSSSSIISSSSSSSSTSSTSYQKNKKNFDLTESFGEYDKNQNHSHSISSVGPTSTILDEDSLFSSPDHHGKTSVDSAYSSLNRKFSNNHGRSEPDTKMSKFCHECGYKFPEAAKFCCECGIKRLAL